MSKSYPRTEEQRQRNLEYQREYQKAYRAAHPDKTKEWRERYILRKADRLRAQQAQQAEGGEQE